VVVAAAAEGGDSVDHSFTEEKGATYEIAAIEH
jgi:hypothetical protein